MLFYKYLSGLIFLLCLGFDAFYTSDTYKANRTTALLLFGWLGIIIGHFCWLANPFYIFALLSQNNKAILISSLVALLLALSFLTKRKLLVSVASSYETIIAYGPGYFLWVLSMSILPIGEFLQSSEIQYEIGIIATLLFVILLSVAYSAYYFLGDKSIYSIFNQRTYHFNRLCATVKEEIYQPAQRIKGVYIDVTSGYHYFSKIAGNVYGTYGVIYLVSFIRTGAYPFEEKKRPDSEETEFPYIRIYSEKPDELIPIDKLEANLEVRSENLAEDLPKSLGITSFRIYVRSRETNEIMAETSFVSIPTELKVCAPTDTDSYSVNDFVLRALNIEQKVA